MSLSPSAIVPGPSDIIKMLVVVYTYSFLPPLTGHCFLIQWLSVLWKLFLVDIVLKFLGVACLQIVRKVVKVLCCLVYGGEIMWHTYGGIVYWRDEETCESDVISMVRLTLSLFLASFSAGLYVWFSSRPIKKLT